jgi:hypothetical protein
MDLGLRAHFLLNHIGVWSFGRLKFKVFGELQSEQVYG